MSFAQFAKSSDTAASASSTTNISSSQFSVRANTMHLKLTKPLKGRHYRDEETAVRARLKELLIFPKVNR